MIITVESTTKTVTINGVPARVWEGRTESGIPVHCFITRIAVARTEDASQFERELQACRPVSAQLDAAYPSRLVL